MDKVPTARTLDVLLFDGVNLLDVAGPVQAFDTARFDGRPVYRHRYLSITGRAVRANCGLTLGVAGGLAERAPGADLLIPGGDIDDVAAFPALRAAIRATLAAPGDARVISVCSGALALAAAGVLDGRVATTHWSRQRDIARHPDVRWDLDRIMAGDGRVWTSAGVTTGIDLALHIIRADCGKAAALAVARELVVQLRRTGGQSQYAMHLAGQFTDDDALTRLIEAVLAAPARDWTLDTLGAEAGMNPRTLSRRFRQAMDMTPVGFVERTRVDHARGLLLGGLAAKRVAVDAGFGDLQRMRRAFQRQLGVGVRDYADAFRDGA
ncbi:GlxA family transcriptional regulator [Jannaschia pohangensis]|uniref:Transcriptional regulator GlxA family, contains an amidase domain and an AraC-type DNA-binding HTH domain n=1 Tax=Jannaschia pohangensis TaxID=390807 RepID=A0A1I3IH76_9RHOB|nr:helix-turn-helix domain-containing protein [Jannaschia pohangensis]SFI47250.1 Transcriptional regulator GlxA family, contains an amidase domain and an AraC-type DNA-binding HTH domain [Jannaschia pohangensis]